MKEPMLVNDYNDINLDSHGIIEASAGTGKTYTLENMVVKILMSGKASIEEILIVTFTEKAAGELKVRIRANLESKLKDLNTTNEEEKKLKDYIENFDNLFISTIHGFCNSVINQYTFENKEAFQKELCDDFSQYKKLLYIMMRKDWYLLYDDILDKLLEVSDFKESVKNFEDAAVNIAGKYKSKNMDILYPEPASDKNEIRKLIESFEKQILKLYDIVGNIDKINFDNNPLILEYDNLKIKIKENSLNPFYNKIINTLLKSKKKYKENNNLIKSFKTFYNSLKDKNKIIFTAIFDQTKKAYNEYDFKNNHPLFYNTVQILQNLSNEYKILNKILLSSTVHNLNKMLEKFKRENNLISYDDMLSIVNDSVNDSFLLNILQSTYKYALVDEFQDTNRIQWNIFKKIFLNKSNKLFIIGDPKQSIYGFRNADIYTYLQAKLEMLKQHSAEYYYLNTNWRSTEKLINSFNDFFINGLWFSNTFNHNDDLKIEYKNVCAPKNNSNFKIKNPFDIPERKKSEIYFIKINSKKKDDVLNELKYKISEEIKFLLRSSHRKSDKHSANITENDICIIVRKSSEARLIEKYLIRQNIKSTIYKKSGLYKSNEALHLKYLLTSIAYPDDVGAYKKALLTDFFNININNLINYISMENENTVKRLFEKWILLSQNRNWSKLFDSILYDTGILYRKVHDEKKDEDSERIITNYKHLVENLQDTAIKKRYDIYSLLDTLNNLINDAIINEEDEDLHRLESEEHKVRIMTIHASKGLEFPYVFIFTSNTKSSNISYYKFHNENNNIIFDLTKNEKNKSKHETEEFMEDQRLFYVAFTRAKFKLYIPEIEIGRGKSKISELINSSIKSFPYKEYINIIPQENLFDEINIIDSKINFDNFILFPKIDRKSYINKKITIKSFSALNDKIKYEIEDNSNITRYGEIIDKNDEPDSLLTEHTDEEEVKLPSGTNTGHMFHSILENIEFEKISYFKGKNHEYIRNNEILFTTVKKYFDIYINRSCNNLNNEITTNYINETCKILHNTLTTPIFESGFTLSDLKQKNRLNEVEFYYPIKISNPEIFLNGFIDMVFKIDNKYFLLDWKSNYLENGYTGKSFEDEVNKHYNLQYNIYLISLIKWLKSRLSDFDYNKNFGGIFYIYLRGIGQKKDNKKSGIFYYKPGEDEYKTIKNKLFEKIINLF